MCVHDFRVHQSQDFGPTEQEHESENWCDSQAEAAKERCESYMVGTSYLHRSKNRQRHDLQRRGESKAHARDLLQVLLREIDATDGQAPRNERKTFAELCDYFEKHYVRQPST